MRLKVTKSHSTTTTPRHAARGGSVLIVVIAMLGLLALLGFTFVTFTSQESSNATYYAEVGKNLELPAIDPDKLFDYALLQLINGAPPDKVNSALWGGRHSLLPGLVGRDLHPYTGQPVNVITLTGTGQQAIDQNYNGVNVDPEDNVAFLDIADSPSANAGEDLVFPEALPPGQEPRRDNGLLDNGEDLNGNGILDRGAQYFSFGYPYPDADYTYPDINNTFLAFNGFGLDAADNPVRVILPSFHRPQYLRYTPPGAAAQTFPIVDWDFPNLAIGAGGTGQRTQRKVMSAHPAHLDIGRGGQPRGAFGSQTRYVLPLALTGFRSYPSGITGPFPFGGTEDVNGDGLLGEDLNRNGVLDNGEDYNNNGILDSEDTNGNGVLDAVAQHGVWTLGPWQSLMFYRRGQWVLVNDPNGNGVADAGEPWFFRCMTAGTTSGVQPLWTDAQNDFDTLLDGGVLLWQRRPFVPEYDFHADADGDGVREAVWLDLDHPVVRRGDGRLIVPMFAMTVYDADGLINLNVHGNLNGTVAFGAFPFGIGDGPDGQPGVALADDDSLNGADDPAERGTPNSDDQLSISNSNLGLTPFEVNPTWALTARPMEFDFYNDGLDAFDDLNGNNQIDLQDLPSDQLPEQAFLQHNASFGHIPRTWQELGNMEWFFGGDGAAAVSPSHEQHHGYLYRSDG